MWKGSARQAPVEMSHIAYNCNKVAVKFNLQAKYVNISRNLSKDTLVHNKFRTHLGPSGIEASSYPQAPNKYTEAVIDHVMRTCRLAHWIEPRNNQSAIFFPVFGRSVRTITINHGLWTSLGTVGMTWRLWVQWCHGGKKSEDEIKIVYSINLIHIYSSSFLFDWQCVHYFHPDLHIETLVQS